MTTSSTGPTRFLGCDVGKAAVTVFDSTTGAWRSIPNRAPDLRRFAASLGPDCLVVCEATGGYEARLLQAMLAASVPAHRADARKVKAFIRSYGTLGKSDAIDAAALARYGAERHASLARWQQPDPVREELQTLVLTRIDLVRMVQAQTNRLAAPGAKAVARVLRAVIATARAEIRRIEARIGQLIAACPAIARDVAVLRGMRGVGPVVSAALVAMMPELGRIPGKQAAALAGVAPHPKESGQHVGYRRTRGGRPEVKRTLFMAALVASKGEGRLAEVYRSMLARGKKPIVAVTAVMRKIIVIANARLRDDRAVRATQVS